MKYRPIGERFDEKVKKQPCGCWVWKGSTVPGGYGILKRERGEPGAIYAHRFSYERAFGPIPEGKRVLHECDTPSCVRPDHLFLGDHASNMKDMGSKGRARVLSAKQAFQVTEIIRSGVSQTKIARMFGVSRSAISDVIERAKSGDFGGDPASSQICKHVRLTNEQKAEIIQRLDAKEPILRIAAAYGVDRKTIRNIRDRRKAI